jgi:hypothetical protein
MPTDEHFRGIAGALRCIARSSIDRLVAAQLQTLAADCALGASQTSRMYVSFRIQSQHSGISGSDKSEIRPSRLFSFAKGSIAKHGLLKAARDVLRSAWPSTTAPRALRGHQSRRRTQAIDGSSSEAVGRDLNLRELLFERSLGCKRWKSAQAHEVRR